MRSWSLKMKPENNSPYRIESLSKLHQLLGLPKPMHPLISLIINQEVKVRVDENFPEQFILSFYKITYLPDLKGALKYGQQYYDFEEGGLFFMAPNQVSGTKDKTIDYSGFTLFIHPDFLRPYPLAKSIKNHGFFSYQVNEMLHLSAKEKETILTIVGILNDELNSRIDDCSQDVIIAQIELLLNYANRFYKRQFIIRKAVNHELLHKLDDLLEHHFSREVTLNQRLPTVQHVAQLLSVSPSYLSDLLRLLTGQNAQQHIHQKLIEKAKEKLTTSNLSVSQIAYALGFEHPQSFSTLFKARTNLSPLAYRKSFN